MQHDVHIPVPLDRAPVAWDDAQGAVAAPVALPAAQQMTVAYAPDGQGGVVAHYVPTYALAAVQQPYAPAIPQHQVEQVRTGIDPIAQRVAAVGIAAAGAGFGAGEIINALAGGGAALAIAGLGALALWKALPSGARTVVNNHHTTVTSHTTIATGWLGTAKSRTYRNQINGQ